MSEKESLNQISESLKQMADSSKEIVDIVKPKPKKPNYIVAVGWIVIGMMVLYLMNELYKITIRF